MVGWRWNGCCGSLNDEVDTSKETLQITAAEFASVSEEELGEVKISGDDGLLGREMGSMEDVC